MQGRYSTRLGLPILLAVITLAIGGCGTVVRGPGGAAGVPAAVQHATTMEQAGDFRGAARAYQQAAAHAQPPQRQNWQLRAADDLLQAKDIAAAKQALATIDTTHLPATYEVRKRLLGAKIAMAENSPEQALKLIPPLPSQLPLDLRVRGLRLQAEAYQASGNLLESARTRVQLDPLLKDPQAIARNRRATWGSLNGLSALALQRLRLQPPPDVLSGWMELAYILKQAALKPAELQAKIAQWRARYPNHPADSLLDQLLSQYQQLQRHPHHIALLLPLSGGLSDAAAAIRNGFLAAYYRQPAKQRQADIRIYDTTARGSNIWSVYNEAVQNGADFIVGPLDKDAVTTLAKAGKLDVPVLALNFSDAPDLQPPDNFYQFSLSPTDEARQVAERASSDGMIRAVAIVPNGDWGTRVLDAFSKRFTQLGGEILDQERYNVADNDFSVPIRHMLELDKSRERYNMLRRITGRDIKFEPRRRQDVDFVFMAAFPRQARLIVPQLRFYHAADVPVYSTSAAYSGTVDPNDDSDLDGIVFCDMPWTLDGNGAADPLHAQVSNLWPRSLERFSRLYAFGIDAFDLLPYLRWLHQDPSERLAGETGSLYMDKQNRVHRSLQWARMVDGKPHLIQQPTPAADTSAPSTGTGTAGKPVAPAIRAASPTPPAVQSAPQPPH